MPTTLFYNPLAPTFHYQTEYATGYDGNNVLTEYTLQSWRTTTTGANSIQLNFGADIDIAGIMVSNCNADEVVIWSRTGAGSYLVDGTMTITEDPEGGRRGIFTGIPSGRQYVQLNIASGSPVEGYWEIGAFHAWADAQALARSPKFGASYERMRPAVGVEYVNGFQRAAISGPDRAVLSFDWDIVVAESEDPAIIRRATRNGQIVGLDIGIETWAFWPLRWSDPGPTRMAFANAGLRAWGIELREVV
jgi:hypothetical protein